MGVEIPRRCATKLEAGAFWHLVTLNATARPRPRPSGSTSTMERSWSTPRRAGARRKTCGAIQPRGALVDQPGRIPTRGRDPGQGGRVRRRAGRRGRHRQPREEVPRTGRLPVPQARVSSASSSGSSRPTSAATAVIAPSRTRPLIELARRHRLPLAGRRSPISCRRSSSRSTSSRRRTARWPPAASSCRRSPASIRARTPSSTRCRPTSPTPTWPRSSGSPATRPTRREASRTSPA